MTKQELVQKFKARPLSWSSISSFEWDKEQWYKRYVMGLKEPESTEMMFGKAFATSIEDGTCEVKELMEALPKKKEHKFNVMFGEIPMLGYADAFCEETFKEIGEVKTGKKKWDQKRVDEHGQITLYALFNFITNKVKPEDTIFTLYWIPTQDNGDFSISFVKPIKVHTFKTKRTMHDILLFSAHIRNVFAEMLSFIEEHV